VLSVDDLGQVASVDLLLKDPHLDLVIKVVELLGVASDNLGDGGTPSRLKSNSMMMSSWFATDLGGSIDRKDAMVLYQLPDPMSATFSSMVYKGVCVRVEGGGRGRVVVAKWNE
jgi:hypothetical protein